VAATAPATMPVSELDTLKERRKTLGREETNLSERLEFDDRWQTISWRVKTFIPKTNDTVDLLDRFMIRTGDYESKMNEEPNSSDPQLFQEIRAERLQNTKEAVAEIRDRPLWWVLGTSLLFEAVVVGLAAWIFCRRDY
jgi:hypothetical protein